ncbi:TPA: hypothetical protein ACT9K7_003246 [Legionella pneumophila]|nr:hypothetical protein [Legionella pneumophila]
MIEVNIWLSTATLLKKRIKHKFFGPLLASHKKGENVGHVNFNIEIDERNKENFDFIEQHAAPLKVKKTLRAVPTKTTSLTYSNAESSHLKPITVMSDLISHSFWPEDRPTKTETIKGKRVTPEFSTHEEDMVSEDSLTTLKISHRKSDLNNVQDEKKKNIDFFLEVSDLEISLEKRTIFTNELNKLRLEKENIIRQQKLLTSSHQAQLKDLKKQLVKMELGLDKTKGQITVTERTLSYLNKVQHPDTKTKEQTIRLNEKLVKLRQERETEIKSQLEVSELISKSELAYNDDMQKAEKNLQQVELAINHHVEELRKLDIIIDGRNENDLKRLQEQAHHRKQYTSRKEEFIKGRDLTEGRHADYSITLPTAESGLPCYMDEIAIIKAMQEERGQKYSIVFNNCANSAKRCLLAGIDENLRAKLMETGLNSKFFEIRKIETCQSLRKWVMTLENKLNQLNFLPLVPKSST